MLATLHADKTRSCSSKGSDNSKTFSCRHAQQQRSTGCMGVCPSGGGLHTAHVGTTMRQSKEKKPCARAMSLWPRSRCCVANRQAGHSARPGNDWTGAALRGRVRGFLLVSPDCRPARPPSSRQQKWTSRLPTARPGA
ncbi:hypothetical protein COCVIDRAFT_107260 [Bipolaris victoriae FI3]|uniref:Uncharacterized protein n=1 Tax=Bipolaris victoriae (strain FI3) TaxID=930091 RepID=W7EA86_BIPV3|nr:hypothetical protein COCVIDRAFT_107260 [Bipolaris victoriae FI3]